MGELWGEGHGCGTAGKHKFGDLAIELNNKICRSEFHDFEFLRFAFSMPNIPGTNYDVFSVVENRQGFRGINMLKSNLPVDSINCNARSHTDMWGFDACFQGAACQDSPLSEEDKSVPYTFSKKLWHRTMIGVLHTNVTEQASNKSKDHRSENLFEISRNERDTSKEQCFSTLLSRVGPPMQDLTNWPLDS